jgi:hypothetical protein
LCCGTVLYRSELLVRQRIDGVGVRRIAPSPARIEYTQWP